MVSVTTRRDADLDALRGIAIVLMVLDHVLAVWELTGAPGATSVVRYTVTRLALPAFLLIVGVLWSRRGRVTSRRRLGGIATAGVVATTVMWALGLPSPEILVVLALVVLAGRWVLAFPAWAVVLGLLQAVNLPLPWTGYQPGYVAAWIGVGVLLDQARPGRALRMPSRAVSGPLGAVLTAVGRAPLVWYLGHVLLLPALYVTIR